MKKVLLTSALLFLTLTTLLSQNEYSWEQVRPSNTGIPGEEIRTLAWSPEGDLWVGARWPFWEEGGIGTYHPANNTWSVWSTFETAFPSENINDIVFSEDGTAWVSTGLGLAKYKDGQWTVYDPSNSPLDHYVVTTLEIAPDGKLWLNNSSSDAGQDAIWSFDGTSEWEDYRVGEDIPFEEPFTDLESLTIDNQGHVYVSNTTLYGLAEFDGASWQLYGEDIDKFDDLAADNNGNIWMISNPVGGSERIYRFDGSSFTEHFVQSPQTLEIEPSGNHVYVGTWDGLIIRTTDDGETWQNWQSGLNTVWDIAFRPGNEEVWVGTLGAVGRFKSNGEWIEDFNTYNTGLSDYFVDNMIRKTNDGYLWFASGEGGLSRFDGLHWRNWGTHNAGSENYPFGENEPMYGVYTDNSGTVWMGGNGVARWEPASNEFTGFWNWENSPLSLTMKYFAEGPDGTFFAFGKNPAIFEFADEEWQQVTEVQPYSEIYGVHTDSEGNIWVAGWFDLHYYDGNQWTTEIETSDDIFGDMGGINCFAIGPDDIFWFGTVEGLMRWDGETFTTYNTENSPLPANNIRGIDIRESDGMIALSAATNNTQSGVVIIEGEATNTDNWNVYEHGEYPLAHWQLEDVEFDNNGDLWVSAISMGTTLIKTSEALPAITYTIPADGESAVDSRSTVSAFFNADLTAIDEAAISISPDPGGVNFTYHGNRLIVLHDGLEDNTTYTVTINEGAVSNLYGENPATASWSFSTALTTSIDVKNSQLRVYPNPATNYIILDNQKGLPSEYFIYDINGRILKHGTVAGTRTTINVADFLNGIYILTLSNSKKTLTKKILIQ